MQEGYMEFSLAKTKSPAGFQTIFQILIFERCIWIFELITHLFSKNKKVVSSSFFKLQQKTVFWGKINFIFHFNSCSARQFFEFLNQIHRVQGVHRLLE